MTIENMAAFGGAGRAGDPGRAARLGWRLATLALMTAAFAEAVFAGAMMSGAAWARPAHALTATLLTASSLTAALVALLTLRRMASGARLGLVLLLLAGGLVVQAALGFLAARKGLNLLWAHIPLGVALVGLAGQATALARRLGGD